MTDVNCKVTPFWLTTRRGPGLCKNLAHNYDLPSTNNLGWKQLLHPSNLWNTVLT